MKRGLFIATIGIALGAQLAIAQQYIGGKIARAESRKLPMDIVLFMFGMDHPIKIGHIDPLGKLSITLPNDIPESIPMDTRDAFVTPLPHVFHFHCDDVSGFNQYLHETPTYSGFALNLVTAENIWAGILMPASKHGIANWRKGIGFEEPVVGSFYEIIYSQDSVHVDVTCVGHTSLNDDEHLVRTRVKTEYAYNLKLNQGFNMIEYRIESIHPKTWPNYPSIPAKVIITNVADPNGINWYAQYFH